MSGRRMKAMRRAAKVIAGQLIKDGRLASIGNSAEIKVYRDLKKMRRRANHA